MKLPCWKVLLIGIDLKASPYAATQSLVALRDIGLRGTFSKISIPTAIFHGAKDAICGFTPAEQMHQGSKNSYIVAFENYLADCPSSTRGDLDSLSYTIWNRLRR